MLHQDTIIIGNKGKWQGLGDVYCCDGVAEGAREYTFRANRSGGSDKRWKVVADRPHCWPLVKGEVTYDLRVGDVVKANSKDCGYDPKGWLHGFLNRRGHTSGVYTTYKIKEQLYYPRLKDIAKDVRKVESGVVHFTFEDVEYNKFPYEFKEVFSARYIGAFIHGYRDAYPDSNQISTTDETAAKWLHLHAPFAGFIAAGEINDYHKATQTVRTNSPAFHKVYTFNVVDGKDHSGFRVESIATVAPQGGFKKAYVDTPIVIQGGIAAFL